MRAHLSQLLCYTDKVLRFGNLNDFSKATELINTLSRMKPRPSISLTGSGQKLGERKMDNI